MLNQTQRLSVLVAIVIVSALAWPVSAQVRVGSSGPVSITPTIVGGPVNSTTGTFSGSLTAAGVLSSSHIGAAAGFQFYWVGRSSITASADKLVQVQSSAGTTGMELNVGTSTLGTCTAGVLTPGSHNFAGEYTGNTSSSCVINFGTPNFTNTPFCFAMSEASTTHPRISASSASSITVTGGVSGEAIQYFCVGRIGT